MPHGTTTGDNSVTFRRDPAANPEGWLIVTMSFLALSVVFSARSVLGLTMPLWEAELGWSRSFVSTGGALALIVMAIVAPVAGNLVDRVGARGLLVTGLVLTAAGMGLTATAREPWQFLVYFSLLSGLGFGIVATHVVATVVTLAFPDRAGLPVGIATSGATAGQLLVIPLLAVILVAIGWRNSYLALAIATALLIPVVLFLVRPRPRPTAAASSSPDEPLGRRVGGLMRSRTFHLLFWSFFICGITTAGVIETHLLPYAAACGYPPLSGAAAYGVLSAFNMAGMIASGWLTDRMNRPLLLGSIYLVRGLSFILLMFVIQDISLLFVFAVVFGLFDYSTVPPTASLVASHLGLRVMGLAMGLISAGHAAGAAVGAFMGGWLFDLFARYQELWIGSVVLALIAGAMVFFLRENRSGTITAPLPA